MNRPFQPTSPSLLGITSVVLGLLFALMVGGLDARSQDSAVIGNADQAVDGNGDVVEVKGQQIEDPPYTPQTKSELQKKLTLLQFKVTQNEETEQAFRNKYWDNEKEGLYRCIVCEQSLFSSETKYKSGTGWPSFYDPIAKDHVGFKTDFHLFYPRKEVHCSRCQAHLGHVFDDGPKETTGKRYCMNSAALRFEPLSEIAKKDGDE